ncbi:DUF983 domain-containing protein [Flavobacterium sp.]|jgi:hypothetical protein|uniref:DUF983 domain-containing protein n=1 Tax=Flavobacterium sp. TaxID=239 RepID=UPI0026241180|nr:DUF983 domain-containing protein [Flavobacterium sp.]
MLKKGWKINSILTGSCPRCQEESMYVAKNPFKLKTIYAMHEQCSHCHLHYEIEPSFFYGAMYVAYAVSIAFGVAIFVITNLILGLSAKTSFISLGIGILILMPITARIARNIYINMFVNFDKDWKGHS